MADSLQDAINAYYAVKTANATGLTVKQVERLNFLDSDPGVEIREIEVKRDHLDNVVQVEVEFVDNDHLWFGTLKPDGHIEYMQF